MAYAFGKVGQPVPALTTAMLRETAKRIEEFSDGEIARLVWAFSLLEALETTWLDSAIARWLECRASRDPALPTLEGWAALHMSNCSADRRRLLRGWNGLEHYFYNQIYKPTLTALEAIKYTKDESEVDDLVEHMQKLITWLDIDYLGQHYTRSLLWHLRLVDPSDARAGDAFSSSWPIPGTPEETCPPQPMWGVRGRAEMEAYLQDKRTSNRTDHTDVQSAFDCFGPHERRILSWFAYNLEVEVPGRQRARLQEEGRIARFIDDEQRRVAVRGERTFEFLASGGAGDKLASAIDQQMLTLDDVRRAHSWLPGLFAQHGRLGHCERQALLEVILMVIATVASSRPDTIPDAIQSGIFDGSRGVAVSGSIHLFVAHFCCISCLSVLCHFSRRLPGVQVHVDYDDCWRTRSLDV
jgi:hypothetical protein